MRTLRLYFLLLVVIIVLVSCKESATPSDTPFVEESVGLRPINKATITTNNIGYKVDVNGQIYGDFIYRSGLWLATVQDGKPVSNIIWCGSNPLGNYIANYGNKASGLYQVAKKDLPIIAGDYLKSLGIPMNADGTIKLFGDEMIYSVQVGDTTLPYQPIYSAPIRKVMISQTVWSYVRSDITDVIFVRYRITNRNNSTLTFNAGYFSDTDLYSADYSALSNSVGYDSIRGLTYTYDRTNVTEIRTALGFAFLDAPNMSNSKPSILAHRIVRKNNYINPEFGEIGFTTPQQVLWALNGLDNYGNPMKNPITNQITKFAFTGNPVTGTGWLDTQVDVRNLLSIESFDVAPNETKYFTVAIFSKEGANTNDSVAQLKYKLDIIRSQSYLWQF